MNTGQVTNTGKDAAGKIREQAVESARRDEHQAKGSEKQKESKEQEKMKDDLDELNP